MPIRSARSGIAVGLLLLGRIVLGLIFIVSGVSKVLLRPTVSRLGSVSLLMPALLLVDTIIIGRRF